MKIFLGEKRKIYYFLKDLENFWLVGNEVMEKGEFWVGGF